MASPGMDYIINIVIIIIIIDETFTSCPTDFHFVSVLLKCIVYFYFFAVHSSQNQLKCMKNAHGFKKKTKIEELINSYQGKTHQRQVHFGLSFRFSFFCLWKIWR